MPVIPSFNQYAPKPDLAGAYLGGAKLAQDAAQESARIQLEKQRLSNQMAIASMEASARSAVVQQQALRDQQEIEISKAYHDAQIGLRQRDLDMQQQQVQLDVEKATRQMAAQQKYQAEADRLIATGLEPEQAYSKAALRFGPEMGLPSGAYTSLMRRGEGAEVPKPAQIELPSGQNVDVLASRGRWQIVPSKVPEGIQTVQLPEGGGSVARIGNKSYRIADQKEALNKQLDSLLKQQADDYDGAHALKKESENKPLTASDNSHLRRYKLIQKRIDEVQAKIESLGASKEKSQSPKRFVWDGKQNKLVPKGE